jgi:putative colanic acid biosynthesis glycosyltransferase WcaI
MSAGRTCHVSHVKIQLWSYNYDPEPTGIGPLSTVWAAAMRDRGHDVAVVAAHPHYPQPVWGRPWRPTIERRDGIVAVRLPLWAGRNTTLQRIRQELTFTFALSVAAPFLERPDVIVAVSPSFPALAPAMVTARLRRVPWVLWLQDILPDGAAATGLLEESALLRALRRFERAAYRSARKIVVISNSFAANLTGKGVPDYKIERIFNPATLPLRPEHSGARAVDEQLVLTMGNIGHTQNLVHVVRAFEGSDELARLGARFVLAGDGVAGNDVRAAITTDRVEVTGVIDNDRLDGYLRRASVAIVSQQYQGQDFNVPSKLMNFMAYGIPTLAAVRPDSEVARIVTESGAGWVTSGSDPDEFALQLMHALTAADDRVARAQRALEFAAANVTPDAIAAQFESVLGEVVGTPAGDTKAPGLASGSAVEEEIRA